MSNPSSTAGPRTIGAEAAQAEGITAFLRQVCGTSLPSLLRIQGPLIARSSEGPAAHRSQNSTGEVS